MMRDIKTREGLEFWDKLNALPRFAFFLSPSGNSVQKFEDKALGNWIDVHEAQKVVDQAQEEINQFRAERDALQLRLNAADQRNDEHQEERQRLIAYGRSCGLDEASTVCSRMAYDTYYQAGSRFKHFVPKAQGQMGDLLIKAANAIASLPDGPYDRFKARQQKTAEKSATA
jgi:hypothetical protein